MLDRDGRYLQADLALVEDVGAVTLEAFMEQDPAAAATPLSALGDALRRMHTTRGAHYGKLAAIARGEASQARRTEDIVEDRALGHLDGVAVRDARLSDARERIAGHVRHLRRAVTAREEYGLIHGELGPDHVLVTPSGEPAMIDIEGLTFFDVEWEHAWLQMRFGDAYSALRPVDLDLHRLEFYRYAQILSLIEGPLRIADTDFPNRQPAAASTSVGRRRIRRHRRRPRRGPAPFYRPERRNAGRPGRAVPALRHPRSPPPRTRQHTR
jgi:hypothetical protein